MESTSDAAADIDAAIDAGYAARDRDNMTPTIEYFTDLLAAHPGNAAVLYELAGSYDTAGEEATAESLYLRAFDAGLSGERRRRALLQYGSTLRNLGRNQDSLAVFEKARTEFPDSDSLRVFHAMSLHAAGSVSTALAECLLLIADRLGTDEIARYYAAIRGNAEYLASLES
ncbi:MAG: tetratricopeptide repeat protein [Rhodococcus sp. (in: high G+C Gram-positive bacteria)]